MPVHSYRTSAVIPRVSYVLPNTSDLKQRGGLLDRAPIAADYGCTLVEIPCDFIKNTTELKRTGLGMGDFLSSKSIEILYVKCSDSAVGIPHILHTEPSLPRHYSSGVVHQAPLKWCDQDWLNAFIDMLISVTDQLGQPPWGIEVHPGDKRNSYAGLADAMIRIQDAYIDHLKATPNIMLENRHGSLISKGSELCRFWKHVEEIGGEGRGLGVVLDIQVLFTSTKRKFEKEISEIPHKSIIGAHVHNRHRAPTLHDQVPWQKAFSAISTAGGSLFINPEVHHLKDVPKTIQFCEDRLKEALA